MKKILLLIIVALGFQMQTTAQEVEYEKPNWYFGVAAGANFNFYRGTTQNLNAGLTVPAAFKDGNGIGLYAAPLVEYHFTNSVWGIMLQTGYDSRQGEWDQVISPCNCPMDLSTDLSYITVEPSVRIAPFKNGFYIYGGPRLAFNVDKSFTYEKGTNPSFPAQVAGPAVNEEFGDVENTILSMQIGAGFDIPLTSNTQKTQFVLSPFVAFQPYFGQNPRSTENWNITTLRAGAALKFGQGKKSVVEETETIRPVVEFSIVSPRNLPAKATVSETFPLRNYIYMDQGSTEIASRYVLLEKDQVKDFKEEQVKLNTPTDLSGRAKRGMTVYYNIMNILGDRMVKNPNSKVTLVGSSEQGSEDARAMAQSVKTYLTDVFSINPTRIAIEGRIEPEVSSERKGRTEDLDLLRDEDRRVSIESNSPALLMEFQSGPTAPLKPVQFKVMEAPVDSYVVFKADGAEEAISSWRLELTEENGMVKNYGPFVENEASIPGKTILGNESQGDFKVKMIGTTEDGLEVIEKSEANVVLWGPAQAEEAMRFSILYEFDDATAITMYEKYLTDVVAPKIPKDSKVIIHGHTDVIGDAENNQRLSLARANNVKNILEKALVNSNRTDVKFEVQGYGEDTSKSDFGNKLPEQRAYNRTVIIDLFKI
ncbi:OmpA family protein [Psychroflexus sediminis]|uniref:Outer membrane protein beta-barrel domain-containing protein n=1 Tax=Psychroflexus sediminis TaxID=470826 RepID=A0A1G7XBB8_9FLAO|nr:OmpA family protein [Psychroflexus sediminis]SDG81532.1 Outer membrane protein beta-barrel domain-containing protein [Psychroflexus sediminis]